MEITVKVDRITISSPIIHHKTSIEELTEFLIDTKWEKISENEFRLSRMNENGTSENVAELFKNPYQHESWRLDTSNHLETADELTEIKNLVSFMSMPKLTRVDIAFDVVNGVKPNMSHRIYRTNASSAVFANDLVLMSGRSNSIQTIYSGKRKSNVMIRYYDKLAEQKSRRKQIPENVQKWERLELQLRSSESENWLKNAKEMLSYFKMPNFQNLKPQDRAMLYAIDNHFVEFSELANSTRSKYRKMISENVGYDTEYSELMLDVLNSNVKHLNDEIDSFMNRIKKDDQTD